MIKKFLLCAIFFSSCAQLTIQDYQNVADLIFQENEQLIINSEYIENRNRMLNQSEKVEKLEKNLDELKDDINDIKSLLTKFLESNG